MHGLQREKLAKLTDGIKTETVSREILVERKTKEFKTRKFLYLKIWWNERQTIHKNDLSLFAPFSCVTSDASCS